MEQIAIEFQMWLDLVASKVTDPHLMTVNGILLAVVLFLMGLITWDWD
jgi:hypothetical protein